MKKMILTGVGSEQRFSQDGLSEETDYYLVFNGGDLRVSIAEEALQAVIQHMYSPARAASAPPQVEDVSDKDSGDEEQEEEQEEQEEEVPYAATFGLGRNGRGTVTDEDGVDQV
jgi:hypothetical protein